MRDNGSLKTNGVATITICHYTSHIIKGGWLVHEHEA
jgi:hypothetical protein